MQPWSRVDTTNIDSMLSVLDASSNNIIPLLSIFDEAWATLLVGSVNDGVANEKSDIDLLVVVESERQLPRLIENDAFYAAVSHHDGLYLYHRLDNDVRVQTTVVTVEFIRKLQDVVRLVRQDSQDRIEGRALRRVRSGPLILSEHRLLHRLYKGTVLASRREFWGLRSTALLSVYLEYYQIGMFHWLLNKVEDLVGWLQGQARLKNESIRYCFYRRPSYCAASCFPRPARSIRMKSCMPPYWSENANYSH